MSRFGERIGIVEALAFATLLTAILSFAVLLVARQSLAGYPTGARAGLDVGGRPDGSDRDLLDHVRDAADRSDRDDRAADRGPARDGAR